MTAKHICAALSALFIFAYVFSLSCNAALSLSAQSAVLLEASGHETLYGYDCDRRLPMASTTKIMTALVAIENYPLSQTVSVSQGAVGVEGSSVYLTAGQKLTMEQLLYAMLLESANDAATAIAIEVSGSVEAFADLMNETAERLGLVDTHFTNPHGLNDDEHYTTARELAIITAYALDNDTFREIVSTKSYVLPVIGEEDAKISASRVLHNHNKLLSSYKDCIGVKTGFTKMSGRCLVSAAERDGLTLIAVTLNAPDDWDDHRKLLDYGFSRYTAVRLGNITPQLFRLPVTGGVSEYVTLIPLSDKTVALERDTVINYVIECPRFCYAPISLGEQIGRIVYKCGDSIVGEIALVAAGNIEAKQVSLWKGIIDAVKRFFDGSH